MGLVTHVTDDVAAPVAELATRHPARRSERGRRHQDAAAPAATHTGRDASALSDRCSRATRVAREWQHSPRSDRLEVGDSARSGPRACPTADTFGANRAAMLAAAAPARRAAGHRQRRRRPEVRRAASPTRQVVGTRTRRGTARHRVAVPRALAAGGMGHRLPRRGRRRHRHRCRRGHRMPDHGQRPDGARRRDRTR